jgi:hypothetical protein
LVNQYLLYLRFDQQSVGFHSQKHFTSSSSKHASVKLQSFNDLHVCLPRFLPASRGHIINEEVKRQRNAKRIKVEIARELGDKKVAEKTIERTFFRKLYNSKYCMKGDPKVVAQTLKKKIVY